MGDIFKALESLSNTPLPALLTLIGVLLLAVGYGAELQFLLKTENMSKAFAKASGIVLVMCGLLLYILSVAPKFTPPQQGAREGAAGDPFFIYYILGVCSVAALVWLGLKFCQGDLQKRVMKGEFVLVGGLMAILVLWRALDVYYYLQDPAGHSAPLALVERYSFVPYVITLSLGILLVLWLIFHYTNLSDGSRELVFTYFVRFCLFLISCRLAWEVVDYYGRSGVPPRH